jgi:basic amino acid/polyamine antiporter, APA family
VELKRQIGLVTAMMIIIADVIGTGIFTTTGQVLGKTGSALSILVLFALGGVIALTGSLCYAEMATMWPEDGGEYVYLKKIYGPLPAFLTGWISLFVAFSLAAAMSSILAVRYFNELSPGGVIPGSWLPKFVAAGIVVFFSIIHMVGVQKGSLIQNILTIIKLVVVFLFIALGFYFVDYGQSGLLVKEYEIKGGVSIFGYASALITIMYAYSGWNGSTYIAGEIKNPEKNLPRALLYSTILITIIYLAMNFVYMMSSSGESILSEGQYTIGALASKNLFGPNISPVFNICIVIILLSSVSVQMMIGPRVTYAMAKDRTIFGMLERVNPKYQTPDLAIIVQMAIAVFYVFIGFDAILKMLIYMGFALSVFPLMAVIGMVYTRIKHPEIQRPFRVPFFPLVAGIYIVLMFCVILGTLKESPKPSLFAIAVIATGVVIYLIRSRLVK